MIDEETSAGNWVGYASGCPRAEVVCLVSSAIGGTAEGVLGEGVLGEGPATLGATGWADAEPPVTAPTSASEATMAAALAA